MQPELNQRRGESIRKTFITVNVYNWMNIYNTNNLTRRFYMYVLRMGH